MESQPQSPEFRNNPDNFHPWVFHVLTFVCVVMMFYVPINNFSVMSGSTPVFLGSNQ